MITGVGEFNQFSDRSHTHLTYVAVIASHPVGKPSSLIRDFIYLQDLVPVVVNNLHGDFAGCRTASNLPRSRRSERAQPGESLLPRSHPLPTCSQGKNFRAVDTVLFSGAHARLFVCIRPGCLPVAVYALCFAVQFLQHLEHMLPSVTLN